MNRKDVPTYIFSTRKIDFVIQITKKISSCSFFSLQSIERDVRSRRRRKRKELISITVARREIIQIETLQNAAKETQWRNFILYFSKNSFSPGEPIQLDEKIGVRVNINTGNWLELRARRQSSGVFVGRFQRELLYPAGCHPLIRVSRISTVNNRPLNPRLNPT